MHHEESIGQIGIPEVGILHVCTPKVSVNEGGTGQLRIGQIGVPEVS